MHPHPPVTPAEFRIEGSKRLLEAQAIAYSLAFIAAVLSAAPWPLKLAVVFALPLHFYFTVYKAKPTLRVIRYQTGLGWHIDGERVTIKPSTVVTPYAIWLHYRQAGKRMKALLITNDALPAADFRRLIVKLKLTVGDGADQ